jgi:DNA-binding PadR family transcriptional regulator
MGKKRTDRQDLLPGTLAMLILKSLTRGVMHSYRIAEHIRQLSDEVLHVEEGSLYPALQRLQVQGWIASEWGHSVNNRRARCASGASQLETHRPRCDTSEAWARFICVDSAAAAA